MAFQYNPSAFEYTPEINEGFRNTVRRPVLQQESLNVGKARGEALRRGLEGDPFEAMQVASARNKASEQLSDIDSGMAYDAAGKRREERMGYEQFGRQSEFQSAESSKARQEDYKQQEKMAAINLSYQKELAKFQNRMQRKTMWEQLPGQIISTGVGMYAGNKLANM